MKNFLKFLPKIKANNSFHF